jgi:hypothetical protein
MIWSSRAATPIRSRFLIAGALRIAAAPRQALSDEILAEVFGVRRTRSEGFEIL